MPEGFTLRKEIYRGRLPGGGVISKEEIYQQGVGCAAEGIVGGKGGGIRHVRAVAAGLGGP